MKLFTAVILFLLLFVAVVGLVALYYIRKGILRFRQHLTGDYDEETFKRMSDKNYRGNGEGPKFDKDYFKGSGTRRKQESATYQQKNKQQPRQATTTAEGTTIIDERSMGNKRKIFEDNEGEYVDFVEEA